RAGWLGGAILVIILGLVFLTGLQQTRTPGNTYLSAIAGEGEHTDRTQAVERASILLNDASSRLMTLDASLTHLSSPAAIDSARQNIKAQEYAFGKLLDSLDGPSHELGPLTASFRSLLSGHRMLSGTAVPGTSGISGPPGTPGPPASPAPSAQNPSPATRAQSTPK
ncbi:MAG: hypothetical protein JST68_13900, partial [Bacteroidetes bacterium]|nr:hypothetical protein [Bacteroidota bacterium]